MRNNQPITNEEYVVPDGVTLVSKTDLKGNILECNDAFEFARGFSRDQLIGQPHNLVRHPDVPEEVFADMWSNLKSGTPWTQIVKNRRADGGFYWVKANATPLFQKGEISGYMSVRSKPTHEEISAASGAYLAIKEGKARIKHSRVITGLDFLGLKNAYFKLNPQYQITILVAFLYLLPFVAYSQITGHHNLIEALSIMFVGLAPPFFYGLLKLKEDRNKRRVLRSIASGEDVEDSWFDPTTFEGKLSAAIKTTALASKERYEESMYQLDNANRLQSAMDQVSSNVMIADGNLNIIYMNEYMHTFFKERAENLKQDLPQLDVNNILGSNIDVFHKNPAHNSAMLKAIKEPTMAHIVVGGYHLDLNVIPVYNRNEIQTSTIVEWRDKTSEVQLLQQVGDVVDAAKSGILDKRIDLKKTDGAVKQLGEKINDLLMNIEKPINATVDLAESLSKGDLAARINGEFEGQFATMQNSLNEAIDKLAVLMVQTKITAENVSGGSDQIYQGSNARLFCTCTKWRYGNGKRNTGHGKN